MKVLHVSVAYINDKFYDSYFEYLFQKNIKQSVYVPYRKSEYNDESLEMLNYRLPQVDVIASPIKKINDRLMYFSKIKKYFRELERRIDIKSYDILHAHHLFSDGGVAYHVNKKYGTPYVVSVRNTDIDVFMKYFLHARSFIKKVLSQASKIIFINPNTKKDLLSYFKSDLIEEIIEKKSEVIPNGVNEFWISNLYYKKSNSLPKLKLIQVGSLIKRKNYEASIHAVSKLIEAGYDVSLDIVGEGKSYKKLIDLALSFNIDNCIKFHGFINNKNELLSIYRNADLFLMPSFSETFGIAYIEAMSQGLPVIYSKGQGLDGFYNNGEIVFSVDPRNPDDIFNAIVALSSNYEEISSKCSSYAQNYSWEIIGNKYIKIYEEIVF